MLPFSVYRPAQTAYREQMTLRPAEFSDASSIATLCIEVWAGTYLKQGINGFFADYVLEEFTSAKTRDLIADPAQFILVSQNTNGIDGVMRLSSNISGPVEACSKWEISTLYVQPRHQGKGIGARLLRAACEEAIQRGASSVWLTTNSQNAPAIAFYLKQGFTKISTTDFRIGNEGYQNDVLVRALG